MSERQDKICIVDDTPANLRLLAGVLGGHGYQVRAFPSGALALRAMIKEAPDLMLLDINMPGMSGFELSDRVQEYNNLKDVPILFISAMDDAGAKVAAYGRGGIDYLSKPFRIEEVLARVDTHTELRRLRLEVTENRHFLDVFNRLSGEMEKASTEKEMVQFAQSALIDILRVGSVDIDGLTKTNTGQLALGLHVGTVHDECAHGSVEAGSLLHEVAEQGTSVVGKREDIERDPRWGGLMLAGIAAVMICPSQIAGRIRAAVTISAKDCDFFTPSHIGIVEQIAQQLALYMELRSEDQSHELR
jgi:DNA-binding response OmpR family regulator